MVKLLLGLDAAPSPHDAADALAVAICHAHSQARAPVRQPRQLRSWRQVGLSALPRRQGAVIAHSRARSKSTCSDSSWTSEASATRCRCRSRRLCRRRNRRGRVAAHPHARARTRCAFGFGSALELEMSSG